MATTKRRNKRKKIKSSQLIRWIVQIAFLLLMLGAGLRHGLSEGSDISTASIDALCPFGAVESLWRYVAEGQYVPKTHPSNMVLGMGLLLGILFSGGAFCGWICPFGTLQDILTWLRTKLGLSGLTVPPTVDGWLRYGRFVILGLVLYMTISTTTLWFAGYDPYRTIFGFGWLFEFNLATQWAAYVIALLILLLSFFIPRFWCKYTCPLGGLISLLGHFSLLRIRREAATCKNCALCNTPCPVGIDVAVASPAVNTDCIGCLACVEACPSQSTLEVKLAPTWLDGLRSSKLAGNK